MIDCKFETKNLRYLSGHIKLMHGPNADVSNVLTCTICEFETEKNQSLQHHINAQHLNQKRFSCNSCDFKSYYKQHVQTHIISKHKGSRSAEMKKNQAGKKDEFERISCSQCRSGTEHDQCQNDKNRLAKLEHSDQQALECKDCKFETKIKTQIKYKRIIQFITKNKWIIFMEIMNMGNGQYYFF